MLTTLEQIKIRELAKSLARAHVISNTHRKLSEINGDSPTAKLHLITSATKRLMDYLQEAGKATLVHKIDDMSVTYTRTKIRAMLKKNEDGMTAREIADELSVATSNVYGVIRAMPDTYIDRWERLARGEPYSAYWCVVIPPEDCPHPDGEKTRD